MKNVTRTALLIATLAAPAFLTGTAAMANEGIEAPTFMTIKSDRGQNGETAAQRILAELIAEE